MIKVVILVSREGVKRRKRHQKAGLKDGFLPKNRVDSGFRVKLRKSGFVTFCTFVTFGKRSDSCTFVTFVKNVDQAAGKRAGLVRR